MKPLSVFYVLAGIIGFWCILTIWVQFAGASKWDEIGNETSPFRALILYNADPFYNLDEQLCISLAKGLKDHNVYSRIVTTDLIQQQDDNYDLYILCANTYNWSPDWKMQKLVRKWKLNKAVPVLAITAGAGSTKRAKRIWEQLIKTNKMNLLDSKDFWLMKPNDDNRMTDKNVTVACDLAFHWGQEVGMLMFKK